MKRTVLAGVLAFVAGAGSAQEMVTYTSSESFGDVSFAIENAIIGKGLVVDHVSHVGEMLERTRGDVGSDVVLFEEADVYSFCSATVSREVMEADPMNIVYCPYDIFVATRADNPGEVIVGYRQFPEGPMQAVQQMLDEIVNEAIGE
ncbi:DUF302 domain-containing protein [Lutimaribacter marinistellae]|uniref:DUF302 domain-containing protein n=1 Tax=Lutimaribacter marinistellae TaxID=1820329 RepID=A0ABV7TG28_9RHOB